MLLKTVIDNYCNSEGMDVLFAPVQELVDVSRHFIFGEYEQFALDPSFNKTLEEKIITSYYTDNIKEDTIGMFVYRVNIFMRSYVHSYYRTLEAEFLNLDPLNNVDLIEKYTGNTQTDTETRNIKNAIIGVDGEGNNENTGDDKEINNTHPATPINIDDDNFNHASNSTISRNKNVGKNSFTNSTKDDTIVNKEDLKLFEKDYTLTKKGKQGSNSRAEMILHYQKTVTFTIDNIVEHFGFELISSIIY